MKKRVKVVAKVKKAVPPSHSTMVYLRRWHSVNGINYGPGGVKVPRPLADLLMEQERNADAEDRQAMEREPADRMVVRPRQVRLLPHGSLDGVDPNYAVSMRT